MPPPAPPPLSGPIGLHLAHVVAGGDEERGDMPAQPG
jgi:hypothetical protein